MVRWNWTTNTWKCNQCDAENNRPLANFCSRCGTETEKATLVAAPIDRGESRPPKEHRFSLGNSDLLLNIFGVALVVEKAIARMVVFPDPLREGNPFLLSRIDGGIVQIDFDQWWVYVLNNQGILSVFPVSALSNGYMANKTKWQPYAENVHKFWLFKNRLLVIDQESQKIRIGDIPSIDNFWAEGEEIVHNPQSVDMPFAVETLVPLQGEDFLVALIGENKIALLTDEGVSDPREGAEGSHWVGSNRGGQLCLAFRRENGEVGIISFDQDNFEPYLDPTIDLQATALHTIDIDGQNWFGAITSDKINLVDPLNRSVGGEYPAFMRQADRCSSFGDLIAGFQNNEAPGGAPLMALFRFDRNSISRPRLWSIDTDLNPVTAPAGFGHGVYVLMEQENGTTRLYCYPLDGDRET